MPDDIETIVGRMKAAAQAATPGTRQVVDAHMPHYTLLAITSQGPKYKSFPEAMVNKLADNAENDADFLAAASPANVLALIDAYEARGELLSEYWNEVVEPINSAIVHTPFFEINHEGGSKEATLNCIEAVNALKDAYEARGKELDDLATKVYVPGLWKCKKCGFTLVQRTLRGSDGAVGVRDEAGERCPNDGAPLWRVSERDAGNEMADHAQEYLERAIAVERKLAEALEDLSAASTSIQQWIERAGAHAERIKGLEGLLEKACRGLENFACGCTTRCDEHDRPTLCHAGGARATLAEIEAALPKPEVAHVQA